MTSFADLCVVLFADKSTIVNAPNTARHLRGV